MPQRADAVAREAAVDPDHLQRVLNVVDLRQGLRASAEDRHLLAEKPLYEVFSLKEKYDTKKLLSQICVILE